MSVPTDHRNIERQLWPFVLLSNHNGDDQSWSQCFDLLIFHLGELELSDKTGHERLHLDDADKRNASEY